MVRVLVIMESVAIKELNYRSPSPLSSLSLSLIVFVSMFLSLYFHLSLTLYMSLSPNLSAFTLYLTHIISKSKICVFMCMSAYVCMRACVCVCKNSPPKIFANKTSSTRKTKIIMILCEMME